MKTLHFSRPHINPILVKELRARMRGFRPYAILTVFLVSLVAAGFILYQIVLQQQMLGTTLLSAQVGQALFSGLAVWILFLVVFLAPALTSGAISSEREQLTYDMLLTTPLKPVRILWGKLIAALSYLFLLIFASIPVFSLILMFGGVEPIAVLKMFTLLVVSAVTFGAVGLFFSSLMRRTAPATVLSYVVILIVIGGTFIAGTVWQRSLFHMQPDSMVPPQLFYLNPFTALASIIAIAPGTNGDPLSFVFMGNPFGVLPLFDMLSPGVVYYSADGTMRTVPIFRATLISFTILTVLLCWISSHLVLPRRRWYPGWSDLSFALLLIALLVLAWLVHEWWYVIPPRTSIPGGPFGPIIEPLMPIR